MLSKEALFARLAEGQAAAVTVVTPNRRLAQALVCEHDALQTGKGLTVWESPDILPFTALVERLYEDALYSHLAAELPPLLTPAQEDLLWQEVIRASSRDLLVIDRTAAQCRDAWRLMHAWRIRRGGQGNEDFAAFSSWSESYRKRTASDVDGARLPDLVASFLPALKKPRLLVVYAFDILPPQAREWFDACRRHGTEVVECQPEPKAATVVRTSFPSSRQEIEAAAKWARARLEAGSTSIGVVVPELQQRRKEVVRVFSRIMQPGYALPGAARSAMPFNVSLGLPLSEFALVDAALTLLALAAGEIPFAKASALLRSPFLGGAESERSARARLDAKIRRDAPAILSLAKLVSLVEGCPLLRRSLEEIFQLKTVEPRSPHDWARHFSALLEAAGFPGERALDSDEFQTRAKWHETLSELAKLERVSKSMSGMQALSVLRRLCRDTLFQPARFQHGGEAPIQVLGILESAGTQFDHLWVSGLTDDAWPLVARPNPFVPIALQIEAGVPEASAEMSLALDRRITAHWRGAANEVVFSWPTKEEDRDLSPSPLILEVGEAPLAVPDHPRHRDLIFAGRSLASVEDAKGPPVQEKQIRGGTRVLADQAACPFRAFAKWRLDAESLEAPSSGLDAAKRGQLLHSLMKNLWSFLKDSESLKGNLEPEIARAAQAAVKELELEGRFAELERERLARLARDWLEIEKRRPPFAVVSIEKSQTLSVAGLQFSGRIDRMDLIESGGHVLIDYKTSRSPSPKHWETPRPDDPQLPLYVVSAKEEVSAVAFAKLRPGSMRFMGFSRDDKVVPGVQKAKAWQPLLETWKEEAEALGGAFAAGEARVDPKRDLATCRNCSLQTLCRVYEKINVLAEPEEGNGE